MKRLILSVALFIIITVTVQSQKEESHHMTLIMGWSSWNHFAVNINEANIKSQADML